MSLSYPKSSLATVAFTKQTSLMLACSVAQRTQTHLVEESSYNDSELCQYRKGFFDHLKPRSLVKSTLRIVTQQGTLIMANFMTDQFEQDLKRNAKVEDGEMTQEEADDQASEWEEKEWEKRWHSFPSKVLTALAKFHAITLVVRLYEDIASKLYSKVTLDKLTMDPFYAARKITDVDDQGRAVHNNSTVASHMFRTSLWANGISFLADYSVHQVIFAYGYYQYIQRRRQRTTAPEQEGMTGAIATNFLTKSARIAVSRTLGLISCSIGAAVGTIVWPGWGTLLFANMGEGAIGAILDDTTSSPALKKDDDDAIE